jgi:hypothetical protein
MDRVEVGPQAQGATAHPPASEAVSLPAAVFGHWVHSHEEDSGDVEVYRPLGWPLPPARGRSAFEIKPDGEFVRYRPGPADVSAGRRGRWEALAPDRIAVSLPDESPHELEICCVGPEVLKIRRA